MESMPCTGDLNEEPSSKLRSLFLLLVRHTRRYQVHGQASGLNGTYYSVQREELHRSHVRRQSRPSTLVTSRNFRKL